MTSCARRAWLLVVGLVPLASPIWRFWANTVRDQAVHPHAQLAERTWDKGMVSGGLTGNRACGLVAVG